MLLAALAVGTGPGAVRGQEEPAAAFSAADLEFFEARVRPLLVERCQECHSGDDPSGGLRLDVPGGAARGGDSGPAAVAGDPGKSRMIQAVRYEGVFEMPPDSRLPEAEVAVLEEWVRRGMPWPGDSHESGWNEAADPAAEWHRRLNHWAWQAPVAVEPPAAVTEWAATPVDRFLESRMEAAGIRPAQAADRATLLRRAAWVLHGIVPTADEVKRFVEDPDPAAFEREVDRLLASPRFGERFARHWLDLVRYAETCGHEYDYPIPYAWSYRDWVIRAFNADVPYDQFVREQIAGDLIATPRRHPERGFNESVIGTGFWFLNEATHGPVDVQGDEAGHIDNRIDVMAKSFLALTVSCARCHAHKFDAISDRDFYALAGILQGSRRQLALLDDGGSIESAHQRARAASLAADQMLQEALGELAGADPEVAAGRFRILCGLAAGRPPERGTGHRLQGEDLTLPESAPGTLEVQSIPARRGFAWEGDRQLWWRDAGPGDSLEIAFESPLAGVIALFANLTIARDYGQVRLELDGQPLGDGPIECFSESLGVTGPTKLGTATIAPGTHRLRVTVAGANEQSIPRHMFGLDWIELVPEVDPAIESQWSARIEAVANEWHADANVLRQAIGTLPVAAGAIRQLAAWRESAGGSGVADDRNGNAAAEHGPAGPETAAEGAARPAIGVGLDRDFADGDAGWFRTGWTFDAVTAAPRISAAGRVLPAGVVPGSVCGQPFQGVLRSPTFEINGPRLAVLMRGGNVQLRVIIDGFDLDIYNPLLFDGLSPVVPDRDAWRWESITGDLGNYIGRRAWLEVIDHGNGAADIAAVWTDPAEPPAVEMEDSTADAAGLADQIVGLATLASGEGDRERPVPPVVRIAQATLQEWLLTGPGSVLIAGAPRAELLSAAGAIAAASAGVPAPMYAQAMTEGTPEDEHLFIRGNHRNPGPVVPRGSLEALRGKTAVDWSGVQGSGRAELADEMTDPGNPLVARVMVNRVWHHLFGRGLVRSPDNFGIMGSSPDHPELLDWLALEFVRDGWSVKRLIRRLMLTRAWQQSCQADPSAIAADPDNRLWGRAIPRRMDGESLRDSMLAISGRLDGTMYGPPVPLYLTAFMQGRGRPGKSGPLDGDGRRTIYQEVRRNFLNPFLLAFDTPIPFNTTGQRNESNVPAQSLILMNDPLVIELAGMWARRLRGEFPDPDERMKAAFVESTGHPPSAEQRADCRDLLAALQAEGLDEHAAWSHLCHVLWNAKAFVFVF